jgi:AcrR family transcriptional regulator
MITETERSAKEKIIFRAQERFLREGFAKTSIADLTSGISMSKKTFYKVFSSKEDLVEQLTDRMLGEARRTIETVVGGPGTFVEKLQAMISVLATVARIMDSPIVLDLERHLPRVWRKVEDFRRKRILENFTLLIQQGIHEGQIRPNVNTRLLVLAFVAAIQNVLRPSLLVDESFSAREAIGGIVHMFFQGVMTPGGREAFDTAQQRLHTIAQ